MNLVNLLLSGGCLIMALSIVRGYKSLSSYSELAESRDVLSMTVAKLELEISELGSEIHKIKVSPNYARKVLRDKYHITEDDEEIIFFPN